MERYSSALKQASAAFDLIIAAIGGMPLDATTFAIFAVAGGMLYSLYWAIIFLFRAHRERPFERIDLTGPENALLMLRMPSVREEEIIERIESLDAEPALEVAPKYRNLVPLLEIPAAPALSLEYQPVVAEVPPAPVLPAPALLLMEEPPAPPLAPTVAVKRAVLNILPFDARDEEVVETAIARGLSRKLERVLAQLCPKLSLTPKPANTDEPADRDLPRFVLSGSVQHLGDRIRVESQLDESATGQELFRFRYQGLAQEQDVILAELTSRILRSVSPALTNTAVVEVPAEAMAAPSIPTEPAPASPPLAANADDRLVAIR